MDERAVEREGALVSAANGEQPPEGGARLGLASGDGLRLGQPEQALGIVRVSGRQALGGTQRALGLLWRVLAPATDEQRASNEFTIVPD